MKNKVFALLYFMFCCWILSGAAAAQVRVTAAPDSNTPIQWTDTTLVSNQTPIKAAHINELRAHINSARLSCGLTPQVWTDDPVVALTTPIRKIHMDELRSAATEVYTEKLRQSSGGNRVNNNAPTYTDPQIQIHETSVKASHVTELRNIASQAVCLAAAPPPPAPRGPPVVTCTPGNGTIGTIRATGQPCWRTFSRNQNGNFCLEENPFCPTCQPANTYPTQAGCEVAENGNCQSTSSAHRWIHTMTGGSTTGCTARRSGCGTVPYTLTPPIAQCDASKEGMTTSYGCGCDIDGTFLRAYFTCKASVTWSCIP
ncbi:MAG: hypothetical protein AB7K41_07140 [Bdellovibrionales bacterium]